MKEIKYVLTFPVTNKELENVNLVNELRTKVLNALLASKDLEAHSMFASVDWGKIK